MPYRIGGCPRCAGALLLEAPGQWSCLQCGYRQDEKLVVLDLVSNGMGSGTKPRTPKSWDKYLTGGQVGRPRKLG